MINIITYYSASAIPSKAWLAYIVLPNGDYWGVRFEGSTEDSVRAKAESQWNKERSKFASDPVKWIKQPKPIDPWTGTLTDPVSIQRAGCMEEGDVSGLVKKQHHLADKVWVINKVTRELKRVDKVTAEDRVATGEWERGGPRSR